MTKPKAKTTNVKKTSPLAKKGKLAFIQPELNSTQTIGEALDEIRQGKVNSVFRTKKPNTDLTNDVNVQELFKNHVPTGPSQYDQLETQLATVEAELRTIINDQYLDIKKKEYDFWNIVSPAFDEIETLKCDLQELNLKVNVAIAVGATIVVTTGIFNLWYWFS